MVVMYRDVPTRTGVKEIKADERDVESLEARGWKVKAPEKKTEPNLSGKTKRKK